MKKLEKLYVWQTKVTDEGVKKLQAALPKVQIDTGWDLADLPKPEEAVKESEKDKEKPGAEKKKEEKKDN